MLATILALLVQYTDGNQRTVHVSDRSDDSSACCGPQYVNCSCNSLADALGYLGTNVLINITTDVKFSSLVKKSDLENVSIVGHSNPTVNCKNTAGIHLKFCYNCIIQGITWHGCGTKTKPGIKLSSSSNITIKNCSFQHSKGQAIVLSGAPGDVNIHHCNFVHNNHYRSHGAAIHHLSSHVANKHSNLAVSYCNFADNKHGKSLVYIENKISKHNNNITIYYSKFHHNQDIFSIYGKNCNIYVNGKSSFLNNTDDVLFIKDHSTIILSKNSEVNFIQNTGHLIFLTNYSRIIFDKNSVALFYNNLGTRGIIYSDSNSSIIFTATCEVTFKSNSARDDFFSGYGGVIYSITSYICFEGNASIVFSNNTVDYHGGAIYSHSSYISFKGNSSTVFNNNVAKWSGGAIYSDHSNIFIKGNSSVAFNYNNAAYGGAIYSDHSNIYIH